MQLPVRVLDYTIIARSGKMGPIKPVKQLVLGIVVTPPDRSMSLYVLFKASLYCFFVLGGLCVGLGTCVTSGCARSLLNKYSCQLKIKVFKCKI